MSLIHNLEVENVSRTKDRSSQGSTGNRRGPRKTWNAERLSIASEACMGPLSAQHTGEENSVGLTKGEAAANFVIGLIGAAILVLPKSLAKIGGLTGMFILSLGFMCTSECALQVIHACEKAELLLGGTNKVASYEDLAGEALGASGRMLIVLMKNMYFLGVLIVYDMFVLDGVKSLFPTIDKEHARWFIVYPIFILGSLVKDLKSIAPFQKVSIFAAFLQCGMLVLGSLCELTREGSTAKTEIFDGSLFDWGPAITKCIFACGGVVSIAPTVRAQMAYPEQCPSALLTGMAIVFLIYSSVVLSSYLAFGTTINDNLLLTINDNCMFVQCILGKVTAIATNLKLAFTVPPLFFLTTSVLEASGNKSVCQTLSIPNIACRVSMMTALFLIGMALPYMSEIIGLISAAFGINLALIIPLLIHYAIKKRLQQSPVPQDAVAKKDWRDYTVHSFIMLISILSAYFGITQSFDALVGKMKS